MSDIDEQNRKIEPAQWSVVAIIVAFAAGAFLYKLLMHERLGHSAAMFLGIPAVLATLLALAPKAKTVTGGILKGITLALLVVAPLLGEGYLCILVASPLFYIVGIVVGLAVDRQRRKLDATLSCVALFLLPMCFEGVVPQLTFSRAQSVEVRSVVAAPADEIEHALAHAPNVNAPLPSRWLPQATWRMGRGSCSWGHEDHSFLGGRGRPSRRPCYASDGASPRLRPF